MAENTLSIQMMVFLFGILLVLSIFLRTGLKNLGIPSLIGFMALGFLIRWGDDQWRFFTPEVEEVFRFLAEIGLFTLLFRVGLESNLKGLLNQFRHASLIWAGNIVFSGIPGYAVAAWLLDFGTIPAIFVGVALTATSVGVSLAVWQEQKITQSPTGRLLLDVAEMDDISGIILMTLLLSAVSGVEGNVSQITPGALGQTLGAILVKLALFGAVCVLFSRYVEERITRFFAEKTHSPGPMIVVAGLGFVIAGMGALLGFSLAIGAFFAGLVFSRDPEAVKLDASFSSLYEIFSPFFFIGIGLHMDPRSLTSALGLGGVLFVLAVAGKLVGNGVLSLAVTDPVSALLISVSMVPRAEIAMVIMQKGHDLGAWAVPDAVFSGMVLVSLATCVISPAVLRMLLKRWPQKKPEPE